MGNNYVERKLDDSGYRLTDGHRIIVDAVDLSLLVEKIREAQEKGLKGGIYTGPPKGIPDFPVSEDALTMDEHREFWKLYDSN